MKSGRYTKSTNEYKDDWQTPPYALHPLLPYLNPNWKVWECAEGEGNLTKELRRHGYSVIGTDILTGKDFLKWKPKKWEITITNPPYSLKDEFLARAYELGHRFAFLLPLYSLESKFRQSLFRENGLDVILPDDRVDYDNPHTKASTAHFVSAWFTYGLDIVKPDVQVVIAELRK